MSHPAKRPTLFCVTLEDPAAMNGQALRLRHLLPELARRAQVVLVGRPGALPKEVEAAIADRVLLPVPAGVSPMAFFFGARGPLRLAAVARALRGLPSRDSILYADSVLLAWMLRKNPRRVLAAEVNGIIAEEYASKRHPLGGLMVPLLRRWEAAGFRSCERLIAVSGGVEEVIAAALGNRPQAAANKIAVIGNGIDPKLFHPGVDGSALRRERGWGGAPVGIMVSSFRAWHGIENLIEAAAQVRAQRPDFRLALVGDGPERPAAIEHARRLGIAAAVDLPGAVAPQEVPRWLAAADIGLYFPATMPASRGADQAGGMPGGRIKAQDPIKLYEYMAMGKAIVLSRRLHLGTMVEAIGAGLLTEPTIHAFAAGILQLIGDPGTRHAMGNRGAEAARIQFIWSAIGSRVVEFLGFGESPNSASTR